MQTEIAYSLVDGIMIASRYLRSEKWPAEMTPERLMSLSTIKEAEPISLSHLAAKMRVTISTMSRMVSSLADDGWVRRRSNRLDGRGIAISLTAKGRRAHENAIRQSVALVTGALGKLSSDEVTALASLATALNSLTLAEQKGTKH